MRFNCVHTFTLEARDRSAFEIKLARYSKMVTEASKRRSDLGYGGGLMVGQADAGSVAVDPTASKPPEALFDD